MLMRKCALFEMSPSHCSNTNFVCINRYFQSSTTLTFLLVIRTVIETITISAFNYLYAVTVNPVCYFDCSAYNLIATCHANPVFLQQTNVNVGGFLVTSNKFIIHCTQK